MAHLDHHRCSKDPQQRDQRPNKPLIDPVKHSVGELEWVVECVASVGGVPASRGAVCHLSALPEYFPVLRTVAEAVEADTSHHQGAQTGPEQQHAHSRLATLSGDKVIKKAVVAMELIPVQDIKEAGDDN